MRVVIDRSGRLVIPRSVRDQVGIRAGEVELTVDGAAVRIEPLAEADLADDGGWLVVPAAGADVDDALVRALRDADRR